VLKDIDDGLVQAGIEEARNVTTGQAAKLVERGKLTQEQADAQVAEVLGRIEAGARPATSRSATSTSWSRAVPERMDIKQAVFSELDAATRATRSWPPTRPRCRSPRWARRRSAPTR